jgi:MIP family channel proteins
MSTISVDRPIRLPTKRLRSAEDTGLHGHPLRANLFRASVAEAVGTFLLVLTIVSVVIAASLIKPVVGAPYGSLTVAVAGGLALAVSVASLGRVSGAHLNPAVTLGLVLNRRFPWTCAPAYFFAQFGGAIGAALAAWALFGDRAKMIAKLGATYPAAGVGVWRTFAAEGIVTFILVLVIVSVATDSRVPPGIAAMVIGSALAASILISGPITGAGVNPARAIGPMIAVGKFTDWWVYLTAPLIGSTVAATLYERLLRSGWAPDTRHGRGGVEAPND